MDKTLNIFENTITRNKVDYCPDDLREDLDTSALLAKASVPYSHRRIAEKYVLMKSICTFQVVQPRITNVEANMLAKYSFRTLENTTISQVNKEISQLKSWAVSMNDELRADSETLLKIRVKELKFMLSNNYTKKTNEMYKGYEALETYLTNIPKKGVNLINSFFYYFICFLSIRMLLRTLSTSIMHQYRMSIHNGDLVRRL